MVKFSTFYPNGEGISANELNRSNQDLDLTEYMDIDEFIQVLQETERITPFGRLKAVANVNQDDVNTVKWFSRQMDQPGFKQSKKKTIPLTSSVLQWIENCVIWIRRATLRAMFCLCTVRTNPGNSGRLCAYELPRT